jgi:hypothetical protein
MAKCCIKWIDTKGKMTPDENESIGMVRCIFAPPTFRTYGESEWYPICAEHAKRLATLPNWVFEWHRGEDWVIGGKVERHARAVPPVGVTVYSWSAPDKALTVLRTEPYSVALTDTLTVDESGHECWHAGHGLHPWKGAR